MSTTSDSTLPSIAREATFDDYLSGQLEDPAFRAAFEDARQREAVIDSLSALRSNVGLTQRQLAERMGVGQSTVSGFETEGSDPRLSTLQRYARAAGARLRISVSVPSSCDWIGPFDRYSREVGGVSEGFVRRIDTARRWCERGTWKSA